MIRKLLIVLGVLAALLLLMGAVGFALPRQHRATSTQSAGGFAMRLIVEEAASPAALATKLVESARPAHMP